MNFAGLDLNLLRVFDAMMAELNTTRAGERIGLSQPAVSTAIGRLRHVTGDELFVREGNRMVATPRARQLAEPVREALRRVEEALSSVVRYDPATSDQTFRISGSDYFSALLMPRLAATVVPEAPGVTVQMLDHPGAEAVRLLGEGVIDMVSRLTSTCPTGPQATGCFVPSSPRSRDGITQRLSPRVSGAASGFRRKSTARCRTSSCRWMEAGPELWTGCWPSAGWRAASR